MSARAARAEGKAGEVFIFSKGGKISGAHNLEGVSTDPSKIQAVSQWRCPETVGELCSFLGFASYYRRFVEEFAKLAAPLHRPSLQVQSPGSLFL